MILIEISILLPHIFLMATRLINQISVWEVLFSIFFWQQIQIQITPIVAGTVPTEIMNGWKPPLRQWIYPRWKFNYNTIPDFRWILDYPIFYGMKKGKRRTESVL